MGREHQPEALLPRLTAVMVGFASV